MSRFHLFLARLAQLEQQLQALSHEFAEVYQEFEGEAFAEQTASANSLDNLILVATHETASTIGFTREDIALFAKFIDFRKAYNHFSDQQLAQLIDCEEVAAPLLLALKKHFLVTDNREVIRLVAGLRQGWNSAFGNRTYGSVKAVINRNSR
ncbi:MAG: hypothetical protein ACRYFX_28490 [Janthinobacterium lividum]